MTPKFKKRKQFLKVAEKAEHGYHEMNLTTQFLKTYVLNQQSRIDAFIPDDGMSSGFLAT